MKEFFRLFLKTGIVLFVLWHMVAVATFSLPTAAQDAVTTWARTKTVPHVTPYLMVTSQWQQWNLFSPDPLRRIVLYRIEIQNAEGTWAYATSITPATYGIWRNATHFKILSQTLAEDRNDLLPLREHVAQILCREFDLPPERPMRIWYEVAIVPYVLPSHSWSWWSAWTPTYEPILAIETTCPSAP